MDSANHIIFTYIIKINKMKWWQKKVRGWIVPFWYSDMPLCSYRFAKLGTKGQAEVIKKIREQRKAKYMEAEIIYKILHRPTGLFYCSRKGRWKESITNLSEKGNHYTSEKVARKVFESDLKRANINKAQLERYNLELNDCGWGYSLTNVSDFVIVEFELKKIKELC